MVNENKENEHFFSTMSRVVGFQRNAENITIFVEHIFFIFIKNKTVADQREIRKIFHKKRI